MFTIVGVLVVLYVAFAVVTGEVYAKSGVWGKSISRQDFPGDFWMTIVIYLGLAIALMTLF